MITKLCMTFCFYTNPMHFPNNHKTMILYQMLSYDKFSTTKATLKLIHTSTTVLEPNHLLSMLQCTTGSLPGVLSSQGRKLTIHLHLLMRLQV